jgi:septal ring factor EnvC (AmiA/AmiB activator)
MKTIKKYWAIIVGAILALFGIAVAAKKKHDDNQIAKTDKKIDDNKQQADVISGKIEAIEDQKTQVKQDLAELIADVKNLKDKKQTVNVTTNKPAKKAKENILNKTNKKKKK